MTGRVWNNEKRASGRRPSKKSFSLFYTPPLKRVSFFISQNFQRCSWSMVLFSLALNNGSSFKIEKRSSDLSLILSEQHKVDVSQTFIAEEIWDALFQRGLGSLPTQANSRICRRASCNGMNIGKRDKKGKRLFHVARARESPRGWEDDGKKRKKIYI